MNLQIPQIMGVLNVTPDSFYEGSRVQHLEDAIIRARQMVADGATILDVGGESTRPGAHAVDLETELQRIVPLVQSLVRETDVCISVDTTKPVVMQAALELGAGMINDVTGFRDPESLAVVRDSDALLCVMHMQGEPRTMQENPQYADVVREVGDFFQERIDTFFNAGIDLNRIVFDPGFGFGKTVQHNLQLIQHLDELVLRFPNPILIGVSRKSTIGAILNTPADQRLAGSLALTVLALERGARIIRTHDVRATMDALRMTIATLECESRLV